MPVLIEPTLVAREALRQQFTALDRQVGEAARDDQAERNPVWRLFATAAGDKLACAFGRLLAWKDPAALSAAEAATG